MKMNMGLSSGCGVSRRNNHQAGQRDPVRLIVVRSNLVFDKSGLKEGEAEGAGQDG